MNLLTNHTIGEDSILQYINGVNLGNWLVPELWMSPELFANTGNAKDAYYLARSLSPVTYQKRMQKHYDTFITEHDFAKISSMGFDSIRIPVPFSVFGDRPPYIGCISYLDKAFKWAGQYGLSILLDLHTVPYSQNGFDNGGLCGVCRWWQMDDEVEYVLQVLRKLAVRYGTHPVLLGIEPLNEPVLDERWNQTPASDPQLAAGSKEIPFSFLSAFYLQAYQTIQPYIGMDKYFVIHDAFELTRWKHFIKQNRRNINNLIIDTHKYICSSYECKKYQSLHEYRQFVKDNYQQEFREMQEYCPIIVGEWCLANKYVERNDISAEEKAAFLKDFARLQLDTFYENTAGHYFWSYKILHESYQEWDAGRSFDAGWFPNL